MAKLKSDTKSNEKFVGFLSETAFRHHFEILRAPMREWQQNRRLPPVLLITGQSGVGKKQTACFLAQWILCEHSGFTSALTQDANQRFNQHSAQHSSDENLIPCGECNSCKQILSQNNVNLTEIAPEVDENTGDSTGSLKIEQFRKLKASAGFGAQENAYKIVLISHADQMTTQAANSVLKLLEEPPHGWIFFLTAKDASLMLPTLVSRCQTLRLKPFSNSEMEQLLAEAGVEAQKRKICAESAQGSWNRALAAADEKNWSQRKALIGFLKNPANETTALIDWCAQEPSHFEMTLDWLEQFTADFIRWSTSNPTPPESYPWVHSDGKEEFSSHVKRMIQLKGSLEAAQEFWFSQAERIAQSRQEMTTPVNRKILIQDLLLPWLGVMS